MHPLALASGGHKAGPSQIAKMPGDLRLRCAQDADEVADADLLLSHEIEEPEAGVIAQCLKEPLHVEPGLAGHALYIYALTNMNARVIFALPNMLRGEA
jgi:hypothetical protein